MELEAACLSFCAAQVAGALGALGLEARCPGVDPGTQYPIDVEVPDLRLAGEPGGGCGRGQ